MDKRTIKSGKWSDPSIWSMKSVPKECCHVMIDHTVTLDTDVEIGGCHINGTLQFMPGKSITLLSNGNIVVHGKLVCRPSGYSRVHTIRFVNVDESKFVGGGMDVLDTDTGLWVMHNGQLDIQGSIRTVWMKKGTTLPFAQKNDEIVNTPQDEERINLSNNVIIEGTASGFSHIFIHSYKKQYIRNVTIRFMGVGIGRYGLHFHHCLNGSTGSVVQSVVIRDCNNHAFVPHASHGILFRDCAAVNTKSDAYWWDQPKDKNDTSNNSDYIRWISCIAYKTFGRFYSMASFMLGSGKGNKCIGCVAVENTGMAGSCGFLWPEDSNQTENVWEFSYNEAHDNKECGARSWQNDWNLHIISYLKCYRNKIGFDFGAYRNGYHFDSCNFTDNHIDFNLHALPSPNATILNGYKVSIKNSIIGTIKVLPHTLPGDGYIGFINCNIDSLTISELPARVPNPPASRLKFDNCQVKSVYVLGMEKGTEIVGIAMP